MHIVFGITEILIRRDLSSVIYDSKRNLNLKTLKFLMECSYKHYHQFFQIKHVTQQNYNLDLVFTIICYANTAQRTITKSMNIVSLSIKCVTKPAQVILQLDTFYRVLWTTLQQWHNDEKSSDLSWPFLSWVFLELPTLSPRYMKTKKDVKAWFKQREVVWLVCLSYCRSHLDINSGVEPVTWL